MPFRGIVVSVCGVDGIDGAIITMELLGIVFSLPAGVFLGSLYSLLLQWVVVRFRAVARLFVWASYGVLAGLGMELLLLITMGAVRARGVLGPGFAVGHFVIFVLGTPAVANLLMLRWQKRFRGKWLAAGVACGVMMTFLVVLQYGVSEALYGVNGDDGSFSG